MPISRIYQAALFNTDELFSLSDSAAHHLARVLRAQVGDEVTLFNGKGGEYLCKIIQIDKKNVKVKIGELNPRDVESPLELYLAQGISRGEKMDFTIQKAVELGISKIIPLFTERCNVKLDEERREKRQQHWQSVAISACEQSGRNRIPEILSPQNLMTWLPNLQADRRFVLSPYAAGNPLPQPSKTKDGSVVLLIGPEGGFSEKEVQLTLDYAFIPLKLGPRILRTETAAIVAITILQSYLGDLGGF